jgi:hypothetical protein
MFCNLALGRAGEYFQAACVLAPFFLAPTFSNITLALITLHHESNGYLLLCLENYELDKDFELSSDSFKMAFQRMLHLSASGHSGMVFEHLKTIFTLKIPQMDSFSCSNFVFISHKVTFQPKMQASLEWFAY